MTSKKKAPKIYLNARLTNRAVERIATRVVEKIEEHRRTAIAARVEAKHQQMLQELKEREEYNLSRIQERSDSIQAARIAKEWADLTERLTKFRWLGVRGYIMRRAEASEKLVKAISGYSLAGLKLY